MARSCADLLPPGASIPRSQCFPAMGVTVTAAFCWRDGPAGFLPVGEGPLTVPVVRLRGFPALQRDHCRLKGAMPSPKAYLVVLLFPGMSYHPRHTCMAIRWHKNATGTSPGLEPGSRRQSPRSRGNHRGRRDPPPGAVCACLVLSCLLTLYTAVMSFEILFPFGLWVFEPDWLFNHSQLV